VDRAAEVVHLAADLHLHLVKMLLSVLEFVHPRQPLLADVSG
jgi:hypothetical protein